MFKVRNITKYSFFCVGCLLISYSCKKPAPETVSIKAGDSTSSGIFYKNLGNIVVYPNYIYYLDIDKDNQNDLAFSFSFTGNTFSTNFLYSVKFLDSVNKLNVCCDAKGYPLELKFGDKIGESLNWQQGDTLNYYEVYSWGYANYKGNWGSLTNGYLGFKFVRNSVTYLGWVRIDSYNAFTIKDYAYIRF
jgi:hypothetical protein